MTEALADQLKTLTQLQKIDYEIYHLQKELSDCPAIEKKLEGDFEKKKGAFKAAEDELRTIQLKQKEKEVELQTIEEKIKKLQVQLYQVKTNKEYAAMELEIKGLKADKSLLEEDIIRLLDATDQAKGRSAKEKEVLQAEEGKLKEEKERFQKRAGEIRSRVSGLEEERKAYLASVDPKLMRQYERLLKSRGGLALVPVVENSCGGCHMELPPQVVNEIQLQEKLIVCESCARILYWLQT